MEDFFNMRSPDHFNLPIELEKIRPSIESSLLPFNKLLPYAKKPSSLASKFSGRAYFPLNYSYPKDINGHKMRLLAQINFSETGFIEPFPKKGILQFFISPSICNSVHSVEEHFFQHYFKVRYFHEILTIDTSSDNHTIEHTKYESFPIEEELALSFSSSIEPVSAMDYRIDHFLSKSLSHFSTINPDGKSIEELYFEHFLGAEHKIGGYPYFIYEDTRKSSPFLRRFDTLLLQIVSNDAEKIMWGDSGIIKFFINRQKLLNLDFSDIYFIAEQYD